MIHSIHRFSTLVMNAYRPIARMPVTLLEKRDGGLRAGWLRVHSDRSRRGLSPRFVKPYSIDLYLID